MKSPRLLTVIASFALAAALTGCGSSSSPTSPNNSLDNSPPPAPTGLALTVDGASGSYMLTWASSASPSVAKYQVYEYAPDPSRDNSYVLLGETARTSLLLDDPATATSLTFRVKAVSSTGTASAFSNSLTAPLTPSSPLGLGGGGGGSTSPGLGDKDPRRIIPE